MANCGFRNPCACDGTGRSFCGISDEALTKPEPRSEVGNCRDRATNGIRDGVEFPHRRTVRSHQGFAQAIDGCIDTVINVHKSILGKASAELLAGEISSVLEKNYEHLKR